jgi:CHC2 zinc finger
LQFTATSRFRKEHLPPASVFYRKEFQRLSRPSRGWARTACPFHQGHNRTAFSVNLETGGFRCFNCGVKGGDVVAYVMLRDRLDFKAAAKSLGAWDEGGMIPRWQSYSLGRSPVRERYLICDFKIDGVDYQAEVPDEPLTDAAERQERISTRDRLHQLEQLYRKTNDRLTELRKGATEVFPGEQETCWEILSDTLPKIREAEADYRRLAGVDGE